MNQNKTLYRTSWDDVLTPSACSSPGACEGTRWQERRARCSSDTLLYAHKHKKVKPASVLKRRGVPRPHLSSPLPTPAPSSPYSNQQGKTRGGTAHGHTAPHWSLPRCPVQVLLCLPVQSSPPGSRPANSYASSHMHTIKHICFCFFRFKALECKLRRVGRLCCSDI